MREKFFKNSMFYKNFQHVNYLGEMNLKVSKSHSKTKVSKIKPIICNECKEKDEIVYDPNHDEIFCLSCGTVLCYSVKLRWDIVGLKK
jgi:ribosomal protein S27E